MRLQPLNALLALVRWQRLRLIIRVAECHNAEDTVVRGYAEQRAQEIIGTCTLGLIFEAGAVVPFVITGLIGINFIIEVAVNLVLVPTVYRLIQIKKK